MEGGVSGSRGECYQRVNPLRLCVFISGSACHLRRGCDDTAHPQANPCSFLRLGLCVLILVKTWVCHTKSSVNPKGIKADKNTSRGIERKNLVGGRVMRGGRAALALEPATSSLSYPGPLCRSMPHLTSSSIFRPTMSFASWARRAESLTQKEGAVHREVGVDDVDVGAVDQLRVVLRVQGDAGLGDVVLGVAILGVVTARLHLGAATGGMGSNETEARI